MFVIVCVLCVLVGLNSAETQEAQYAHPAIERELRGKRKDIKEKRIEIDLLNMELSELRRERDAYLRLAWFACLSTTGALCAFAWVLRLRTYKQRDRIVVHVTPPTTVTPDSIPKPPPFVDDDLNIPFHGFPVTASDEIVDQTKSSDSGPGIPGIPDIPDIPDIPKTLIHWNVKGIGASRREALPELDRRSSGERNKVDRMREKKTRWS
jgi:hypothetical protein